MHKWNRYLNVNVFARHCFTYWRWEFGITFFMVTTASDKLKINIQSLMFVVKIIKVDWITIKCFICVHMKKEGGAIHSILKKYIIKEKYITIFNPQKYTTLINTIEQRGTHFQERVCLFRIFKLKWLSKELEYAKILKDNEGNNLQFYWIKILRYVKSKPSNSTLNTFTTE